MIRLSTLLFFCICMLSSCERWAEPPALEVDYFDSKPLTIHESRPVIDSWYIGSVAEGEVINFNIQVVDTGKLVSDIYPRQVEKNWKCRRSEDLPECSPYSLTRQCTAYYRDQMGQGSRFFDLSERENWPFRVLIAGKEQFLNDSFTFSSPNLYATLRVTGAMLTHGDDLILKVIKPPGLVEVGFMGFGKCQEIAREDLDIDPSEQKRWPISKRRNREVDLQTNRILHATLTREQKKLDQGQVVRNKWTLPNLKAGEALQFQISAHVEKNQWSKVYSKDALAFWQSRKCVGLFFDEKLDCTRWEEQINNCKALYRTFTGVKKIPFVLKERHQWPFILSIGGIEYQLADDYSFEDTTLYASLTLTPEMLSFGNDLVLEVIQPQQTEVKIGFLGYDEDHCTGFDEEGFHTTANKNSVSIISSTTNHLNILVRRQHHERK